MNPVLGEFYALVDRLNAWTGGAPVERTRRAATLAIPSGRLALGDPQQIAEVEVTVPPGRAAVAVRVRRYPDGGALLAGLELTFPGGPGPTGPDRTVGAVAIDSAKLVVADAADLDRHWGDGTARIGLICSTLDADLVAEIKRRFGLRTRPPGLFDTEVVGPVSEDLRREVVAYLETLPDRVPLPWMMFRVRTEGSFERVNFDDRPWAVLPVGNAPRPTMFVCETGRGDGNYPVRARSAGGAVRSLTVSFAEEE